MKKSPSCSFLFLLLLLGLSASAAPTAPLTRDLGQGLAYHRAATLPADLPTNTGSPPTPLVLDLRYATGDAAAATVLHAWLKFHAAPRTPIFLLVNPATAPALLAPLADQRPAGLLLLGTTSAPLVPDITIKVTSAAERLAYDALAHGTALTALLTDAPEKIRNDEAQLAKDYHAPPAASAFPLSGDANLATAPPPAPAAPPQSPPPLIDSTLQRAVHLHRALQALKKL